MRRSSLLLLHAFCLRLQNEDPAFIRKFIQCHVSFQHTLNTPNLFQPMTTSDTDVVSSLILFIRSQLTPAKDSIRCYRRLSYSCHIPHLVLEDIGDGAPRAGLPGLKLIEPFKPVRSTNIEDHKSLCQVSSSVLLTFFLPEASTSRQEEIGFLTAPRVLWALLTVNCNRSRSSSSENNQPTLLTPVAQFLEAINGALQTQRDDERNILDTLKARLAESDDRSLFDDENFTKSYLYHWAVQVCDMVCHSISSTTKFMSKISEDFLKKIEAESHPSEHPGIELWSRQWGREIANLEELREEFLLCRQDVQERVS